MKKQQKAKRNMSAEKAYLQYFQPCEEAQVSPVQEVNLEQPPMFEYAKTYTTYSITEKAITA